jgi:hypothetical protein
VLSKTFTPLFVDDIDWNTEIPSSDSRWAIERSAEINHRN